MLDVRDQSMASHLSLQSKGHRALAFTFPSISLQTVR